MRPRHPAADYSPYRFLHSEKHLRSVPRALLFWQMRTGLQSEVALNVPATNR
jgi:hypothetical protein